jgi:cytochrome c553
MVAGAEERIIVPMAGLRYLHLGLVAGAATLAVQYLHAAVTVDINPQTFEGRTSAAIAEFRAAVALDADLAHGRELFAACAECHRADGSGSADGTIPVIAGQHVSVLVKQLVDFRHDRRWHAKMQDAATRHDLASPQDLLDVAAYAASLKRPAPSALGSRDGAEVHRGQLVYYRDCEGCHGRLAEGDLRTLRPRLAGQHYEYLLRQLNETASGQRPGMDEMHVTRIRALSDDERAAVAAHLARLSPGFSPAGPP